MRLEFPDESPPRALIRGNPDKLEALRASV
jgi:hypothetical protein